MVTRYEAREVTRGEVPIMSGYPTCALIDAVANSCEAPEGDGTFRTDIFGRLWFIRADSAVVYTANGGAS